MPSLVSLLSLAALGSWEALAATTCNVLDYGGVADNDTDIGAPILEAYNDCVVSAVTTDPADTVLYVPAGAYALRTNVEFATKGYFTFEIDGTLYMPFNADLEGNMFWFNEISYNVLSGSGSVNGNGGAWRPDDDLSTYPNRPRLFRFENSNNNDISGVKLINAPMFHMTVIGDNNVVHNQDVVADVIGETDGYDISGNNNYVHDVSVENGDECVTVKTPTDGFVAKSITCIYTAGCNIGSFGDGGVASVNNVSYTTVSLSNSDAGILIKSYPSATGTVTNAVYKDFTMDSVAYPIDIDMYWMSASTTGTITVSDITFDGISGTGDTDTARPLIKLNCISGHECTNIVFEDVDLTSSVDKTANVIENACGTGLTDLPAC